MIKREFTRLFFSARTLVLVITSALFTAQSYYFSWMELQEYIREYNKAAADLNLEIMKELIDSYNGFRYLFQYFEYCEEFGIYVIVLYAWLGIFVAAESCRQLESGYGNLIVSRIGYRRYKRMVIRAQSLYITAVLGFNIATELVLGGILGGFAGGYEGLPTGKSFLLAGALYLLQVFYCVCINRIAAALSAWVKNVRLLQCIPVLVFFAVPMLYCTTIGQMLPFSSFLTIAALPWEYFTILLFAVNTFYPVYAAALLGSMAFFWFCSHVLDHISTAVLGRNYL